MFEFDGQTYEELLADYPDLGFTKWTQDKVDALERIYDDHVSGCDECQDSLLRATDEDIDNGLHSYCPVGESFNGTWLDADLEFSWQPDFPGHGAWADRQLAELEKARKRLHES